MTIAVHHNLSNCEKARKNDFGALTEFEPVASALALQCSTSLSYEDPYTGGRTILIEYPISFPEPTILLAAAILNAEKALGTRLTDKRVSFPLIKTLVGSENEIDESQPRTFAVSSIVSRCACAVIVVIFVLGHTSCIVQTRIAGARFLFRK